MADSLHPLSDGERLRLKDAFRHWDAVSVDSQLTHILYSTGMHPACLADPARWSMSVGDGLVTWDRAKTRTQVSVPLDPDLLPFLERRIADLRARPIHPVNIAKAVGRFGAKASVAGLTPRGLRHDFAYRAVVAQGFIAARELTGTTTAILMGYARRELAREAGRNPKGLF